jgi:hypothetical protein
LPASPSTGAGTTFSASETVGLPNTIDTDAPGSCVSATIRRLNASEYCRRFVAAGCCLVSTRSRSYWWARPVDTDGIWLGTYENGPARLFHFTAATLSRLLDGETLAASQAAIVLTIPDHSQGAAIGGGELWIAQRLELGHPRSARPLRPARRGAVM